MYLKIHFWKGGGGGRELNIWGGHYLYLEKKNIEHYTLHLVLFSPETFKLLYFPGASTQNWTVISLYTFPCKLLDLYCDLYLTHLSLGVKGMETLIFHPLHMEVSHSLTTKTTFKFPSKSLLSIMKTANRTMPGQYTQKSLRKTCLSFKVLWYSCSLKVFFSS